MLRTAVLDVYGGDWPGSSKSTVSSLRAAKAGGTRLLIAKASEGKNQDPHVYDWVNAGKEAGLEVAVYHFGHTGDPEGQADLFSQIASSCQLTKIAADRFVPRYWLDWEREDKKATGGVQLPPMTADEAATFEQRASQRLGEQLGTYTGDLGRELLGSARHPVLSKSPLWLADYTFRQPLGMPEPTWANYLLWQYTGDGQGPEPHSVPGFEGKSLDLSHYAGDRLGTWSPLVKVALAGGMGLAGLVVAGPVGAAAGVAAGLAGPKFFNA